MKVTFKNHLNDFNNTYIIQLIDETLIDKQ